MRVRSHSMETMVGSHRHRSPGVGGGVPASLSGGGLPQSTSECTKSTFTVGDGCNRETECVPQSFVTLSLILSLLCCQPSLLWRAQWNVVLASSLVSTLAQNPHQTNTLAGWLVIRSLCFHAGRWSDRRCCFIVTNVLFCLQRPKTCRDLPPVPRSEVRDIIKSQLTWDLPQQREVRTLLAPQTSLKLFLC